MKVYLLTAWERCSKKFAYRPLLSPGLTPMSVPGSADRGHEPGRVPCT